MRNPKKTRNTALDAIGRQSSAVSFPNGREGQTEKSSKRRGFAVRSRRTRVASADRLREADQLLCGDDEYAEHQMQEHFPVSAHSDRVAAVRVLEQSKDALHASVLAIPDGLGRDDVDELRADVVDLLLAAPGVAVDERRVSEPFGHRPDARRVVRRIGQVVEIVERCTAGDSRMAAISVVVYG